MMTVVTLGTVGNRYLRGSSHPSLPSIYNTPGMIISLYTIIQAKLSYQLPECIAFNLTTYNPCAMQLLCNILELGTFRLLNQKLNFIYCLLIEGNKTFV
jgi:hypothetical protein